MNGFWIRHRPLFNYSWAFFPFNFHCSKFSRFSSIHCSHSQSTESILKRFAFWMEMCLTANEWVLRSYLEFICSCFVYFNSWEVVPEGAHSFIRWAFNSQIIPIRGAPFFTNANTIAIGRKKSYNMKKVFHHFRTMPKWFSKP